MVTVTLGFWWCPRSGNSGLHLFSPIHGQATYLLGGAASSCINAHPIKPDLRISPGERKPALGRPTSRGPATQGAAAACCGNMTERQGGVGASAGWPASRFPPSAERKHDLPRLGNVPLEIQNGAGGLPGTCHPEAACMAIHHMDDPAGKVVWEWHACTI